LFSKRKHPLPYCRGNHFHDTPATMSHWRFIALTVFWYSRSLLGIKSDFKVQNLVQGLVTTLVKWSPRLKTSLMD